MSFNLMDSKLMAFGTNDTAPFPVQSLQNLAVMLFRGSEGRPWGPHEPMVISSPANNELGLRFPAAQKR